MRLSIALVLALLAGAASAQDQDDAAALALPGSAPPAAVSPRPWRLFVEGAVGRAVVRDASLTEAPRSNQRFSVDLQVDATLGPGLRGLLADRLDVDWQHRFGQRDEINTLKEAYLSWQLRNDVIVDLGRINQYSGVAVGYNPTDFFRGGALRSVVSVDPASIKKNRQGSVMLRGQILWDGASLAALYSPGLGAAPSDAPFSVDWGATNPRERAMLVFSKRLAADFNPQWLLYKEQGAAPQVGMNLTRLLNDASVGFFEWSGGRSSTLLSQALGQEGTEKFRNRMSSGLTYTTSDKLSLTLEYEYSGAGLDQAAWMALPQQSLPAYIRYRAVTQSAQEMPTQRATLFYATWQDLLIGHLDSAVMVRRNSADRSRLSWAELRYRWTRDELALQWQGNGGGLLTEYGAAPLRKTWQLLYMHFF
jgi:opacity protein-like surface antigen